MRSLKFYMISLMKDERGGVIAQALKTILLVLSWIYRLAVKIVDLSYVSGIRPSRKMNVPVVSVGNITLGGTGKTPFTMFLADYYRGLGRKPAILIRGYGDDEHRMLRDELADVPVFPGQDRIKNAEHAVREGNNILILDDGFQHRRIKRDLDILLLDSGSVFGNGFLFPRGILREPAKAVKRADILVITKADRIDEDRRKEIFNKLNGLAPGKVILTARHKVQYVKDPTGSIYPAESLKGIRVCVVCGIADPVYFEFILNRQGADIVSRVTFGDHHSYTQKDIDNIAKRCFLEDVDKIVITQKDYVKLKKLDLARIESKLIILSINMDIGEGKEQLIAGLNSIISG